jgi:tetratricopeptide (TPR) repeat protein
MRFTIKIISVVAVVLVATALYFLLPRDAAYYCQRASARMAKGEFGAALSDYNNAIKRKPDFVDAYIGRGDAKYRLNDPNGALADYKKAIELKPDLFPSPDMPQSPDFAITNDIANQARSLIQAKDYVKLDELAEKYRASKESYADGVWKLSSVYDALVPSNHATDNDWDARLETIALWTLARPESITARVAWANALMAYAWKARGGGETDTVTPEGWNLFFSRLTQAAQILKQAKSLKEQCPLYYRVLLRTALGLQAHRSQFDAIFNQAIKSEPGCETYYFGRAMYLLPQWYGAKGEWQSDLAKSADKIGGENGDMLYAQVVWNVNWRYNRNPFTDDNVSWTRVDKGFEVIEKRFPDSLAAKIERVGLAILENEALAIGFYKSGRELQDRGNGDGAILNFSKAIELNTNYVFAYVHRGILKRNRGDFMGAMADYNRAIEIDPGYSTAFYNRGVAKQLHGDIDGAMADFTKAIELRPDYALAYTALGNTKRLKGDNSGANADFQQANRFQNSGK